MFFLMRITNKTMMKMAKSRPTRDPATRAVKGKEKRFNKGKIGLCKAYARQILYAAVRSAIFPNQKVQH